MSGVGILLVARMGSTRLPGKLLLPVMERPILEYLIERLKRVQRSDRLILCTTRLSQDQPLVDLADRLGLMHYRGDTDDVLLRMWKAAAEFDVDIMLTVGGDDVLCDPTTIDEVADVLIAQPAADFAYCPYVPVGTSPYGVKRSAIEELLAVKAGGTDGWERYFSESDRFLAVDVPVPDARLHRPDLRLTLDYQEDFDALRMILEELWPEDAGFSLHAVLDLLERRPEVLALSQERAVEWKRQWKSFDISLAE